jgi:GNAT superfamily N-acetyltransferase
MDTHIAQRLDEHILETHQHFCQSVDGGVFERTEDWVRGYTGSTVSTFNLLLLLKNAALTDDLLSDTAAYFDDQRVPHVVAFDEHRLTRGTEFLHVRNYQPLPPMPGMILLGPPRRLRSHPDLVVKRVRTEVGISIYCSLVSRLFGLSLRDTTLLFPINQLKDKTIRHYVGFLDDAPVAVGTGVVAEGIVSVWNVATHDDVRRHGMATALLSRLLDDAWDEGCDSSILYSSAMAYSLFQKLGYELYTQRRCFLPPEW